ncbi:MAG TPA: hypothetical protein VFY14_12780 [Streptomyces sp.]|nr:hypothetical protein [Streptomyces sp.]
MVLARRTPRGGAGVSPAPDRTQTGLIPGPGGWTLSCLAPNETLGGDPRERAELLERLAAARAAAGLDRAHPGVRFSLLSWVLGAWPLGGKPLAAFYTGASLLAARYEDLGLPHLLPIDRVWVGMRSDRTGDFGGFHRPGQGYRYVQMGAVVTRYGDLTDPDTASSPLVALDLLRGYAHDCLHYGSYRQFRLRNGEVHRDRYGINCRDRHGTTYSAPDPDGAVSTRNIGVIMEGATDREATAITREAARQAGISEPADTMGRHAFRDVTGRLTPGDLDRLTDPGGLPSVPSDVAGAFLTSMGSYGRTVKALYEAFLSEIGGEDAEELHDLIVAAMISGSLTALSPWLDQRHGPGAFVRLFRSAAYQGKEPGAPEDDEPTR